MCSHCLASRFDWFPSQIFYWYEILWIVNWIIAARRNHAARWSWARSGLTAPAQAAAGRARHWALSPVTTIQCERAEWAPGSVFRESTYNQREDTRQVILTNWCHQSDQWIIREWELARGFQPGPVPTPEWFCLESWERERSDHFVTREEHGSHVRPGWTRILSLQSQPPAPPPPSAWAPSARAPPPSSSRASSQWSAAWSSSSSPCC